MTRLLPLGDRRVRLENGHVITALPSLGGRATAADAGDRVRVEIGLNQLRGWRLARHPDSLSERMRP